MSVYDYDYITDAVFRERLQTALSEKPSKFEHISVREVEYATILPGKPDPDPSHIVPWGMGGTGR